VISDISFVVFNRIRCFLSKVSELPLQNGWRKDDEEGKESDEARGELAAAPDGGGDAPKTKKSEGP
jgi:hypothetical protein